MLERTGTALVLTLINLETFRAFADGGHSTYAAHMCDLYARGYGRVAAGAGVRGCRYAGTDAGSTIEHQADEVAAP